MKAEILTVLRDCPDYVSGQTLCERFGVSRTAVWKVIKQLEKDGYVIEAVPNRGYRLVGEQDVLSREELESRLHFRFRWIARSIYYKEVTDSTNTDAKVLAEHGAPHGTLVVTASQEAGKGRRGRGWNCPAGVNVAMSVLLRPNLKPDQASMITLVQAYSVALTVEELCGLQAQIKWPNDIVVNGKKVCGILTEMNVALDEIDYVIVGTGINVNMDVFPEEIAETATSLKRECGHSIARARVIEQVLAHFEEQYERFEQNGNLGFLKESYEARMVNLNREVRVLDAQHPFEGIARGIDDYGELLVEKPDKTVEKVYAGEVSVRGLYGYV